MNRNLIGTAWSGTHVVIIRCTQDTNKVISFFSSLHAPTEPLHPLCTETLSIYLSIGYSISFVHSLTDGTIEYILTK
ncbi:hypothetical protein [Pseudalkalibacillus hwajinpoensis]|uniref:Uncharacterized protein n=1 Tax=Guptibacillus hwajinpoensis TaxID=208199 RepID=A0A4U1ML75_9BACL|nr:hypothetical protein [Pseudalkalibacillus hwajinpoensis]TKD71444.1 hypothetical protein FBF83_01125 [Pseudalkalibacillus hwajinpoensis]